MREAFYFSDDTAIINYSKKYITTNQELVDSELFDAFLDHYIDYLKKNQYDMYKFVSRDDSSREDIKKEVRYVTKALLITDPFSIDDPYAKQLHYFLFEIY